MNALLTALILAVVAAPATPAASPAPAASPSPAATASPATKHFLKLDIPPGWVRTESGRYNEWRSADGLANFRVSISPPSTALQGPNAAATVQAQFQQSTAAIRPNAEIVVTTIQVCNGTQPAYRVVDPLGVGSQAFMMLIPGTVSTGLINYELLPGGKLDPAMLSAIDKICWP